MQPIWYKLFVLLLSACLATAIAFMLEHFQVDPKISMGVCLAAFGATERVLLEARLTHWQQHRLQETLRSFFAKLENRERSPPPWPQLQQLLSDLLNTESAIERRILLDAALTDVIRLKHHTSYIALKDQDTQSLRKLFNTRNHNEKI